MSTITTTPDMVRQMANLTELTTESRIQGAGLTAPRLIPDDIDEMIADVQYHQFPGTYTVACCLTLTNKFNLVGYSTPVSPDNFDVEICRELAFQNARSQIWKLEEYLLNQQLQSGEYNRNFN